jgi:hypothetical protein
MVWLLIVLVWRVRFGFCLGPRGWRMMTRVGPRSCHSQLSNNLTSYATVLAWGRPWSLFCGQNSGTVENNKVQVRSGRMNTSSFRLLRTGHRAVLDDAARLARQTHSPTHRSSAPRKISLE